MASRPATTILRAAQRSLNRTVLSTPRHMRLSSPALRAAMGTAQQHINVSQCAQLHISAARHGIMPESSDPPPREAEAHDEPESKSAITIEEYHLQSDQFLDALMTRLEQRVEEKGDIDCEYAAGVLSIEVPKLNGTYVLNKQPPNRQLWLSSPISGPKRYDWVVSGESMNDKEGSGVGDWVYLRDGSSLAEVLRKEIGVNVHETDLATEDNEIAVKATEVETSKKAV